MEDCSCVLSSQTSHQSFPSAFTSISISISLPHRHFVSWPLPTPPSNSPTPNQPPRSPAPLYLSTPSFVMRQSSNLLGFVSRGAIDCSELEGL
uniref:Uncharacterized protein n=1 Tax=Kalanchoe fedtschenkoi TaxID=63787 RepID=A0A7N0UGK3_KALFE